MRRWHFVVLPFAVFAVYVSLMFLFSALISDSVIVMLLTHLCMSIIYVIHSRLSVPLFQRRVTGAVRAVMILGTVLFWFMTSVTATFIVSVLDTSGTVSGTVAFPALFVLLTLVVAPVSEEFLFRSVIFKNLKQEFSPVLAYLVSALVFAITHVTVQQVYVGFFCGLLFACVYDYTGRIRYSILVHVLYNCLTLGLSDIIRLPVAVFSPAFVLPCNVILIVALFGLIGYVAALNQKAEAPEDETASPELKNKKVSKAGENKIQNGLDSLKSALSSVFSPRVGVLCRQYEPDILLLLTTEQGSCVFSGPVSDLKGNEYADVRSRRIVLNTGKAYLSYKSPTEPVLHICYLVKS